MTELKDWLNSINLTKKNLIDEDPSLEKEYNPYIVNRIYSGHLDSVLFSNEMNKFHFLDKRMQYDFYLNSLRKKKRFAPWLKKGKVEDLEAVKKYYGYSEEKAQQAMTILSKEQIKYIKQKLNTGGRM